MQNMLTEIQRPIMTGYKKRRKPVRGRDKVELYHIIDNPGAEGRKEVVCARSRESGRATACASACVSLMEEYTHAAGQAGWGMELQLNEGGDDKGTRDHRDR